MRVVRLLAGTVAWALAVAGAAWVSCAAIESAGHPVGAPPSVVDLDPVPAAGAAGSVAGDGAAWGEVSADCLGVEVEDWVVRPAVGWTTDTQRDGDALEVRLADGSSDLVEVRVTCRGGRPTFDTRTSGPAPG
ncbi:MAG TPA: hypothetical protein VMT69_11975 [Kineosporiaceae bacterium]|nr:hypothetical protein [Kineosporiaceae bacterium]